MENPDEKKKNKSQLVEEHLNTHGHIDTWEAIQKYKATRLSAIIFNLRKKMDIESVPAGDSNSVIYYVVKEGQLKFL